MRMANTMHILLSLILLLAVNLFSGLEARAEVILKTITRHDDAARLQLTLTFDELPVFNLTTTGRRINLIAKSAVPSVALSLPATDDKMIKVVNKTEKNGMFLSFYFRYPPQRVTSESRKNDGQIVLDILLGDQHSASKPELAPPPQTVGIYQERDVHSPANPVNSSAFAKNWRSFFIEYESPLHLLPTPAFHLPPFPLAAVLPPHLDTSDWLPEEILEQATEGKWFQVCLLLREQIGRQSVEMLKERLVLTYAEALVRAEDDREVDLLLQRIILQYPDTPMAEMAAMLQMYQKASHGDPTDAYYEFRSWLERNDAAPFSGSYRLLLAELALMANRFEDAKELLNDQDMISDSSLAPGRQLRQADLLSATNQHDKALIAYENLAEQSTLIETDPMSLARFANELYATRQYAKAAKRYQQLADLLVNRPQQDRALFRMALAQLHIPAMTKKTRIDLQQISNSFPETEGGLRSQIKQTDVDFVANRIRADEAETVYGNCAVHADSIAVREECTFKLALVKALSGDGEGGISQSMQMLRGFQSGRLRTEATALIIQQLPGVIRRLVKNGEYVKALVLATQNKILFDNRWLDTGPMHDLALACDKLGMTKQAADIYRYLFDISNEADQEKIYLPLIQSLSASNRSVQIEEYADRYLARYPQGADRSAIFVAKVLAVYNSGQTDKALALMTAEAAPNIQELEVLKGRIYFEQRAWQQTIDTLTQPEIREILAQQALLLPLAESYFQLDQHDQALPLFQRVVELNQHGSEQARFRQAQIARKKDDRVEALKLFTELAEKGTDTFWAKLAREEAAILKLDR